MKVHQAIAHALFDTGAEQLYGLIGDANLFMVNSYINDCGGKYLGATHEAAAVLMALGHARVSGATGVATVTHGPALTNALTALVEGVKAATSIVLLAGDTPGEDREHAQSVDQRALVLATGAGFEPLRSPQTVAEDLNRAFYRARTEHRPIVFNMPLEFQWQEADYQKLPLRFPEARSAIASSADMDEAIGIIASARRPVVVAGRGAVDGEAAIQRFAERIEAPVATSLRGKGLFADDPFNLGICGTVSHAVALDAIGSSDCLIAFGASLNKYTAGLGGLIRGKRIIQVNPLASQIGRFTPVTVGLVGDPGLTADAMVEWLDKAEIPGSGARTDDLRAQIAAHKARRRQMPRTPAAGTVDLFELAQTVDQMFPRDRVYVSGTGRFIRVCWPEIAVQGGRDFVDTIGCAAIGLGLGTAMGAAVAAGGRPTLLVLGDGGLMLGGLSELATAAREQLNLVVVVCNDGGYGAEYVQFLDKDMDPALSLNHWAGFAPVAQALGCDGRSVTNTDELRAALQAATAADRQGPFLIDVKIDPAMTPYYQSPK